MDNEESQFASATEQIIHFRLSSTVMALKPSYLALVKEQGVLSHLSINEA